MQQIRFKPPIVNIPKDDPFKEDLLARKTTAEALTDFVSSQEEPFVLAINSPWGSGKTTFLRMWRQHLENNGIKCLSYNAWENDFCESPLVSLIGELSEGLEEMRLDGQVHKDAAKYLRKAENCGASLIKIALPAFVKIATAGTIDVEDIADLAEDAAKKQIEAYNEDKKSIVGFRKELTNLVEALVKNDLSKPAKPIVFIIDELDRCRPTYAIKLLENVKHLFCVNGLVFVIAIDREQFHQSIKTLYGLDTKADGYLRRFIDLEFRLPEPDIEKFAEGQFSRFGIKDALDARPASTHNDAQYLLHCIPDLFSIFGFSLRTQEQCFTQLAIALRTTPPQLRLYSLLLSFLICLRTANSELYRSYCKGASSPKDVLDFFKTHYSGSDADKYINSYPGWRLEAALILGMKNAEAKQASIRRYSTTLDRSSPSPDKISLEKADVITRDFSTMANETRDIIEYLYKKIEFAQNFLPQTIPAGE